MNDEAQVQEESPETPVETPAQEPAPVVDVRAEMREAFREIQQEARPQEVINPEDVESRTAMALNLRDDMIEEAESLLSGYPPEVVQQVRREIRNITGLENLQISKNAGVHITLAKAAAFGKGKESAPQGKQAPMHMSPVHSEVSTEFDSADKAMIAKYETLLGVKFTPEELKELANV